MKMKQQFLLSYSTSKLASTSGSQTANISVNLCPPSYGRRSAPCAGDIRARSCNAFDCRRDHEQPCLPHSNGSSISR